MRRAFAVPLIALALALACAAQQPLAARDVELTAADGVKLKATYFAAGKAGPGVLLLHQCNRQRKMWDELAARLAAAGLNVLTLDYRGYGESGGTPNGQWTDQQRQQIVAEKWPGDIDAAFQYLGSQPGVKRDVMGAGGASCGVNQSIQLARRHPQVKSLVLLSGFTDRDGRRFLRQSQTPMFFSAADDDGSAVEHLQWLYDLTPNPGNRFQRYATGGHGIEMFAPHQELAGLVVEWLTATLVKTPGKAPAVKSASARSRGRGENILGTIDQGGAARAAQMLAEARRRDPKAQLFSETLVNTLGYEHLAAGDTKGAIEILKLNVTAYPGSPNVYDSLSDAYLADGQNDLARQNAEKTLELLATDTTDPEARREGIRNNAEQKLKQLGRGKK